MAFPRLRRQSRPSVSSLGFVIRVMFASAEDEGRAWRLFSDQFEDGGQLTSELQKIATRSALKPERVRVAYRRGSVEVLVALEGLRIGYELISEYGDFRESAEMLLRQFQESVQQYFNSAGFGPVFSSGTIIGLPSQPGRRHSLAHHALNYLLVTQIGIFVLGGIAVWRSKPILDGVTHYQWYEFVPMTHQFVVSRVVWGIALLSMPVIVLLFVAIVLEGRDG